MSHFGRNHPKGADGSHKTVAEEVLTEKHQHVRHDEEDRDDGEGARRIVIAAQSQGSAPALASSRSRPAAPSPRTGRPGQGLGRGDHGRLAGPVPGDRRSRRRQGPGPAERGVERDAGPRHHPPAAPVRLLRRRHRVLQRGRHRVRTAILRGVRAPSASDRRDPGQP